MEAKSKSLDYENSGLNETLDKGIHLEKKLSPLKVWALAFGCIIGWGAFVLPGNSFLVSAGPLGTTLSIVFAAAIMVLIAQNYSFMINIYPIAGGEFNYARNEFGTVNGFICAWFLGLSYATLVPMNATALALIGRNLMGNVFQFGFHYTVSGYDLYFGELLLSVCAIIIFAVLSIRGVKFAGAVQVMIAALLVISVTVIGVAALFSSKASLSNLSPAFSPNAPVFSGMAKVFSICPFLFVGFDTVPQASEELSFSPKKSLSIMTVSIIFGGFVYILLNTVAASVALDGYSSWSDYIDDLGNLSGISSLPTFNAAKELLGNAGLFFIGIAVFCAILSGIIGFYMATSRLIYSMAKEGVIPSWFGKLDDKYKTPKNAIIFHMIMSLIAPFFGRVALGWLVDMSSLGAAIGYGYTSMAAFKIARKVNNKMVMITGIIGTIMAVIFAVLLIIPIPGLGSSIGKESYFCLIVWIILGIIFIMKRRK